MNVEVGGLVPTSEVIGGPVMSSLNGDDRVSLTVVIPTRNRSEHLQHAIDSALALRGAEVEVIVVDDASEIPVEGAVEGGRVRLIRSGMSPRGPAGSRNLGLANATSEFVTFLDDDDSLDPDFARRGIQAITTSSLPEPVSVLQSLEVVDGCGEVRELRRPISTTRGEQYQFARAPGRSRICHNSLICRTDVLHSIGGFDDRIRSSEHGDLFFRLSDVSSIEAVDEVGYRLLDHAGHRNSSSDLARARAELLGMSKHGCRPGFTGRRRSWHLRKAAKLAWRGGDRSLALIAMALSPIALVSCRIPVLFCSRLRLW